MAEGWVELSSAQRSAFKTQYAAAGIKLITAGMSHVSTPFLSFLFSSQYIPNISLFNQQLSVQQVRFFIHNLTLNKFQFLTFLSLSLDF